MPVSKHRESTSYRIEVDRETYFSSGLVFTAVTWHLLSVLHTMAPRSKVRVKNFQADIGLADDPTDEAITVCIAFAPPVDGGANPTPMAVWATVQRWRSLGTPAMVLDVTERFDESFDEQDAEHTNLPGDTLSQAETQQEALCLFAYSNTTSYVVAEGVISFTEWLYQRVFSDGQHGWHDMSFEEVVCNGCH